MQIQFIDNAWELLAENSPAKPKMHINLDIRSVISQICCLQKEHDSYIIHVISRVSCLSLSLDVSVLTQRETDQLSEPLKAITNVSLWIFILVSGSSCYLQNISLE